MSLGKEAKGSHMAVTLDIEVYEYIGRKLEAILFKSKQLLERDVNLTTSRYIKQTFTNK